MPEGAAPDTPAARDPRGRQAPAGRRDSARFDRGPADGASLVDYLGVIQKRRIVAIVTFLAVVVPVVPAILIAPSVFESSARLLIDPAASSPISFKDASGTDAPAQSSFETQYETLLNRTVARKTIEQLKLWDSPAFMASDDVIDPVDIVRRVSSAAVGLLKGRPPQSAADKDRASVLVDRLLPRLSIRPVENSRLVDVVFASQDPKLAASVANTVAQLSVEQDMESRFQSASHASEWLDKRLAEQRAAVDASEAALQRYREAHGSVSLDDRQNITVQKLADLNTAVTRAKTDRMGKEGLYRQLVAIQNNRAALDTFPLILSNTFIQQLKAQVAELQEQQTQLAEKYGERYPEMIRVRAAFQAAEARLQNEIAKTVEAVRNDYLAALDQEQSLSAALEAQKSQALDLNRIEIEYGSLQREAASNRQVLESLLQQAKQSGLVAAVNASNIRIAEQAVVPSVPVRPQRVRSLVLTILGAGLLSLGLVFVLEFLDARVKSPEEIRMYLGVPCLGMIPVVEGKVLDHAAPLVGRHSSADFSESLRRIRTNLMLSASRGGMKMLAVTSTSPREGKTVVASNLAVVLAQAGRRVLLIDADMRRPQVHEAFALSQKPGLSEALTARTDPADILHRDVVPGLDILTAGATPPNPAELLALPTFRRMADGLSARFDYIIIDCPPVMAVTDASLVANEVSGVVFVVDSETTSRAAARTALDELRASRENVLGAILNRVDLRGNPYYYARYYRADYEKYYRQA